MTFLEFSGSGQLTAYPARDAGSFVCGRKIDGQIISTSRYPIVGVLASFGSDANHREDVHKKKRTDMTGPPGIEALATLLSPRSPPIREQQCRP